MSGARRRRHRPGTGISDHEAADSQRIDRVTSWVADDPELAAAISAAIDPVEIAAQLESHGVSSRVAVDSFGYDDVFSTAEAVYRATPFHDAEPPAPVVPQKGGPVDLLRGGLYALPAVLLPVVVVGFGLHLRWWVLPISLTVAWGTSQGAANGAWTLLGRKDSRSDAWVALMLSLVTGLLCLGLALAADGLAGASESSTATVAAIGLYVAASGALVFQRSERLLALCMVPAAVGSLLSYGRVPFGISRSAAAWCVVATAVLVVLAANRYVVTRRWHRPRLVGAEWAQAGKFLAYGTSCGLLLSALIGFAGGIHGSARALSVAVWPLLLTLGLMEWQLRSFRNRATTALSMSHDLEDFAHRVGGAFLRSITIYVGGLAALSLGCVVIGRLDDAPSVPLLLVAVGALGIAFFMALLLTCSGRISMVLRCWLVTFAVLAGALVSFWQLAGHVTALDGLLSVLIATASAIVLFVTSARPVLVSPFSY